MKRVLSESEKEKQCTQQTKKRDIKCCISCGGVASFDFNFCPKGCHYDVCIECTFGFTEFVNGSTFDKIRVKCMVCREPLPTFNIETVLRRMLARRKKFYTVLTDRITEERIVVAKDKGDILISKVHGLINRHSIPVYTVPIGPAPIITTRTLPVYQPGYAERLNALLSIMTPVDATAAVIIPPPPPYTTPSADLSSE
jgi:hypothetical protein